MIQDSACRDIAGCEPKPAIEAQPDADRRFRNLLSPGDWASLPIAVRQRFSKRIELGESVVFTGQITVSRRNIAGWLLGHALRVVGAPLPLSAATGTATTVSVTEDGLSRGQNWTRVYVKASGFPQVIHSTKRFSGPTGLEEYIGRGISMALVLTVSNGGLVFTSGGYSVTAFGIRARLPRWLEPGLTIVTHRETSRGKFLFTLDLIHPLFGTLIRQEAIYSEVRPCLDASS